MIVITLLIVLVVITLMNLALACAMLAHDDTRVTREAQQRAWDEGGAAFADMLRKGPFNG